MLSQQALRHVVTRLTDEGLIIEVFALPDAPLFEGDTATPTPVTAEIVGMLARMAAIVTNKVAVAGHVPSRPVILADNPVWDLSTARADAVRRGLESGGLDPARLSRVTGHADRSPANAREPQSIRNDRFEVTLLRSDQ
jgi:chemotaxis protein MotB